MFNNVIISDKKIRLDKYLFCFLKKSNFLVSRTKIQQLINKNKVLVNNKIVCCNYILKIGDKIFIKGDLSNIKIDDGNFKLISKDVFFDIVFEDDDLIIVNKPNNLVVHPSPGHYDDTVLNGLLNRKKILSTIGIKKYRQGIVHRIDRQTTGLLVVAKNNEAHKQLQLQIKNKIFRRKYLAIVHGNFIEKRGKIIAPIGRDPNNYKRMIVTDKNSKVAITSFVVVRQFKNFSYLECDLETGRTHQIRVHLKFINHSIYGDPIYGDKLDQFEEFGQYLHAYKIIFKHFRTGEMMTFEAPLPNEIKDKLAELEKEEVDNKSE